MANINTAEARESPEDIEALINVAEGRKKSASELQKSVAKIAQSLIDESRKKFKLAINHGGLQKVLELIESGIAVVGPLSYLLIAVSGLSFTWGFYRHFDSINILDYLDIPDFLLSAFSSPASLGVALVSLLVATFVLFLVYRRGMKWRARASTEVKRRWHKLTSMPVVTAGALIVIVLLSVLVGYLSGGNVTGPHNLVTVTSNNGTTFPGRKDEDSEYVALLGTTSNFHIFIECESSDTCLEGGVPFVVPSANVSTLEFRARDSHNGGTDPEPSDLLSALHEINTSIKDLEIAGPLDVEELVNSLTELLKNDPRVDQLKESLLGIAERIRQLKEGIPEHSKGLLDRLDKVEGSILSAVQSMGGREVLLFDNASLKKGDSGGTIVPFNCDSGVCLTEHHKTKLRTFVETTVTSAKAPFVGYLLVRGYSSTAPFVGKDEDESNQLNLRAAEARAFSAAAHLRELLDADERSDVPICIERWRDYASMPRPEFANRDALVLRDRQLAERSVVVQVMTDDQCPSRPPDSDGSS